MSVQGRMIGQLLCAGRAVVDVRTSAQELIRAKSYDLPGEYQLLVTVQYLPCSSLQSWPPLCFVLRMSPWTMKMSSGRSGEWITSLLGAWLLTRERRQP